jgi:uncharacterized protein (DUF1786 family)
LYNFVYARRTIDGIEMSAVEKDVMKAKEEHPGLIAIDVGGGTQDVLVYLAGWSIENCPKMIMPSPTRLVAGKIAQATARRRPIFLHGELMGGGTCTRAAKEHIAAALPLYATEEAALTFYDDLERVREMGVVLTGDAPAGAVAIRMGDVDNAAITGALDNFGVAVPDRWAVAVQDHGFSPKDSNREVRFRWYRDFIETGGRLEDLAFREPPALFTRMRAVHNTVPSALVMDTGSAAIAGALMDDAVREKLAEGIVVVNAGNYHVMCAMVRGTRMVGLLEHHTGLLDSKRLRALIDRFRAGEISDEEVRADGGHGCYVHRAAATDGTFDFVAVTGPRRELLRAERVYMAVPYGDMMLTGCFGLLDAAGKLGMIPR